MKNDRRKWWFEKVFYIFIIFIPVIILVSQINNELFYKEYSTISGINSEKIDVKNIKAPEELINILKLDNNDFNEISKNSSNKDRLNIFYTPESRLKADYENFVKIERATLLLNDNNIYLDYNYDWRNYNLFGKEKFIGDIYKINDDLEYIYNCSRKDECFLNIKQIKEKIYIDDDGLFIILFYLIVGFIFIKIFPNIFKILYIISLPFSVLFLLIKKYFLKLEEIEKKLKK